MGDRKQNPELVAAAEEHGIPVNPGMSDADLVALLEPQPPTENQLRYLAVLAGRDDLPIKTFGQAWRLLSDFQDLRNTEVIEAYGWSEGTVISWNGGTWLIMNIYGSASHRMRLQPVNVVRNGDTYRVAARPGKNEIHNPFTLRGRARTVDMTTGEELPVPPNVGTNPSAGT